MVRWGMRVSVYVMQKAQYLHYLDCGTPAISINRLKVAVDGV